MSSKETILLRCPCEKEHTFEETFPVQGPGNTTVQLRCPNPQCPGKNQLLSFPIPFTLKSNEEVFKGVIKQ